MAAATLLSMAVLAMSPKAIHAEPEPVSTLVAAARQALLRNDGIDAEMKLREALERGASRNKLAAFMGGAYLRQGDRVKARRWLAPALFSPDTAAEGFRVLAQLEQQDGDLVAADRAYGEAKAISPRDPELWVEIGRLRYRQGQHLQAIQAADHAIVLNRRNVRALEFRGQLVRDRYGLLAALPWFETALMQSPKDVSVLVNYAATLGEMGRAEEMLIVTRRILQVSPGSPQAYYLQAVLAARAGHYDLARGLMARTRGKLDDLAGAVLLDATLQISAGNLRIASERCEQFLKEQPSNMHVREILAHALYLSGQHRYLTLRFQRDIARGDASPYLLTVVARGYEGLGEREQAGALLDRAAIPEKANLRIVPQGSAVGDLMAQGRSADALARAEQDRSAHPGSFAADALAGDVQLALGHAAAAQDRYAAAARIRMSDSLLQRRFEAYRLAGDRRGAAAMVRSRLIQNPGNRTALRLQATLAIQSGNALRAATILDYLRRTGSQGDVQLLTDLSLAQLRSGSAETAESAASQAYRLQRSNPWAAQALALAYSKRGVNRTGAAALLDKARKMTGDNPSLVLARARPQSGADARVAAAPVPHR